MPGFLAFLATISCEDFLLLLVLLVFTLYALFVLFLLDILYLNLFILLVKHLDSCRGRPRLDIRTLSALHIFTYYLFIYLFIYYSFHFISTLHNFNFPLFNFTRLLR